MYFVVKLSGKRTEHIEIAFISLLPEAKLYRLVFLYCKRPHAFIIDKRGDVYGTNTYGKTYSTI